MAGSIYTKHLSPWPSSQKVITTSNSSECSKALTSTMVALSIVKSFWPFSMQLFMDSVSYWILRLLIVMHSSNMRMVNSDRLTRMVQERSISRNFPAGSRTILLFKTSCWSIQASRLLRVLNYAFMGKLRCTKPFLIVSHLISWVKAIVKWPILRISSMRP